MTMAPASRLNFSMLISPRLFSLRISGLPVLVAGGLQRRIVFHHVLDLFQHLGGIGLCGGEKHAVIGLGGSLEITDSLNPASEQAGESLQVFTLSLRHFLVQGFEIRLGEELAFLLVESDAVFRAI